MRRGENSPAATPDGYERIRSWLHNRCGIYYPDRKKELLANRLSRVRERFGLRSLDDLAILVEGGGSPDVQLAVMHAASTNHTYFCREPQVLHFFRDRILSSLSQLEEIRIWSAAASSGDEAYSIAIYAAELLGREQATRRVAILGTDISSPVIARAETGIYGAHHLELVPTDLLERYFVPLGSGHYQVAEDIRRMCTFRRLNLKARPFPFRRGFHVVFCRNVLYYFDRDHQQQTLEALHGVTESGGWLLTSVTESVRDLATSWVPVGGGIYRKKT